MRYCKSIFFFFTDGQNCFLQNVLLMKVPDFLPFRNHETNQPRISIEVNATDDQSNDSGEEKQGAGEYILDLF